jgi:tRNA (guanine-N7-)-methyltransferase
VNPSVGTPLFLETQARRRQSIRDFATCALGEETEIVWEIGCGHGHFLTAYAAAHPNARCVGIDIAGNRIARALKKSAGAKLPNLTFLRADARLFIESLPRTIRVKEIFLLFPDPWPKLRHHKHRIVQPDFLTLVADRGTPGCRVCFRTDFRPYFEHAQHAIREHPRWHLTDEPWPYEFETVFQQRACSFDSLIARRT